MSRIGKLPITIPAGVTITVEPDNIVVQGPKGRLEQFSLPEVVVTRHGDTKPARSQHGLMRSLINNMVIGVTKGFEKKLQINGVGFRLMSKGQQDIEMALGFSHPVHYHAPDGITLAVNKMELTVSGIDKQQVGQVAAEIRALKKPEPYKGKGIKYADEVIIRKVNNGEA